MTLDKANAAGKADGSVPVGQADNVPQTNQDKPNPDGFLVGTYKNKDEAEKGFREMQETIRRLQSERDKALQTKDILMQLAENLKAAKANESNNGIDADAEFQRFAKELDEGGGVAVAQAFAKIAANMEQVAEEKASAKVQEVLKDLNAIKENLIELSPEYQVVDKEKVSMLQERYGLSKQQAIKMAKDLFPSTRGFGTTGTSVATSKEPDTTISPETMAFLKQHFGDLKPQEIEFLKQKYMRR